MAKDGARPADSRDMYAVHIMFRREFAALPALVRRVPAGDRERAAVVADHVGLVVELLHYHHRSEDELVWPKLLTRAAQDVAPIVELMEWQHGTLDGLLQAVEQHVARWRESADRAERDRLADAVEQLLEPLGEHLVAEEQRVLPLIDRHLTADEWAEVGNRGLGKVPPAQVPILFGMLLLDATDEHRTLLSEAIPAPVYTEMSQVGPIAYRQYRREVFADR